MKWEKVLLPLDVANCPVEVFEVVQGFMNTGTITLILLHVVSLRIHVPENRIYQELSRQAEQYLHRLADAYLLPFRSILTRVRIGETAQEILAEAEAEGVDVVFLPTYRPSFWDRFLTRWKPDSHPAVSPMAAKIVREAPCGVFLLPARTRFNCEKAWAGQ